MSAPVETIAPLLGEPAASTFVEHAQRFGTYRMYLEHEQLEVPYGKGLLPRHDAVLNYLRTRVDEGDDLLEVGTRTSYFREEYAYGERTVLEGVETMRDHEGIAETARSIHELPVIEPAIVYANVMLPGQELAVHTDVPEFRGLNRKVVPQWLLVVMHHSALFDDWRLPIATAIAYFGESHGADLVYWPDGPDGAERRIDAAHDTAVVLDTDSVFHGVAPVGGGDGGLPPLGDGARLVRDDGAWQLVDEHGHRHARYDWDDLRFSVSWKAYCFADEADRDRWRQHTEDAEVDTVLDRLAEDLRARGHDVGRDDPTLGETLIDEYIRFPAGA